MIETRLISGIFLHRSYCERCNIRGVWLARPDIVEANMALHERTVHADEYGPGKHPDRCDCGVADDIGNRDACGRCEECQEKYARAQADECRADMREAALETERYG